MTPQEAMVHHMILLKGKPLKEKLIYILTYYYRVIIGIIIAVFFLVSWVFNLVNMKESVLNLACVNAPVYPEQVLAYSEQVAVHLGIDRERQEVYVDTNLYLGDESVTDSYETVNKIFTLVASEQIDAITGDYHTILQFAYADYFEDLSLLLSEEEFDRYADLFLYIDLALIENADPDDGISKYPDPSDSAAMEKPIPVLIRIPSYSGFMQTFYPDGGNETAVGIVVNTPHPENVIHFLRLTLEAPENDSELPDL